MARYRLYVGPASLTSYAEGLRQAGYSNVIASASFVHFDSERDAFSIVPALCEHVGYLPSLREITQVA
jgi:hypothetical protein